MSVASPLLKAESLEIAATPNRSPPKALYSVAVDDRQATHALAGTTRINLWAAKNWMFLALIGFATRHRRIGYSRTTLPSECCLSDPLLGWAHAWLLFRQRNGAFYPRKAGLQ